MKASSEEKALNVFRNAFVSRSIKFFTVTSTDQRYNADLN